MTRQGWKLLVVLLCLVLTSALSCAALTVTEEATRIVTDEAPGLTATPTSSPTAVDTSQPIPSVTFVLNSVTDGYELELFFQNYELESTEDRSVKQGSGRAHILLNNDRVVPISEATTRIESEWLQPGENELVVALNAANGSAWTLGEAEIGTMVLFSAESVFPLYSNNLTWALGWTTAATNITTDLGYEVEVATAYLTSATLELIPCDEFSLRDWLLPISAFAGHGIDAVGESRLSVARVEAVPELSDETVGEASASFGRYCSAHYLVAAAYETAENLPENVDMVGKSVYVTGRYRLANSDSWVPFEISTNLAWGRFVPLVDPLVANNSQIEVTVLRDAATMFDGVQFEDADSAEQAKSILRNLLDNTTVEISLK